MKRFTLRALALYLMVYMIPVGAFAQTSGKLVGTVSGSDGVIAGASVVITDNQSGKTITVKTDSDGGFTLPQLDVGLYTVKVTAPGFKTFSAENVKIDVGKEYSLTAALQVGNIEETVTVTAGTEIINATNGELSNTVNTRQIQELPLNGRNPLSLITLQPGTSSNGATNTVINGQRTSFTNVTRDGINVQDNFIRANATDFIPDRPNADDVGEFTIVTQNAGAELGYGASQVQFVTPRGSNAFHGGGYIYNRNSYLAANSFFNNAAGNFADGKPKVPLPFLNRNQFGGKMAGPIVKEKLFFFAAYEGFRLRQSTSALRTVLTTPARGGVFTYRDNAGVTRTLNVLTTAGVPADAIVQSRFLANIPDGNTAEAGDQLNTTGFRVSRLQNQNREAFTSRVDYEINANNTINGVYEYKKEFLLRPDIDNGGFTAVPFGNQFAHTPFFSVSYRRTIGATLSNELRGGWQRSDPTFDRVDAPAFFATLPLVTSPESTFERQGRKTIIGNIQDNAVWAKGQHSFRFGGQMQIFRVNPFGPPAFSSSTVPTVGLATNVNTPSLAASQFPGGISAAQLGTANSLLALLGGLVSSEARTFTVTAKDSGFIPGAAPIRNLNYENYSGYFSDQWRVKPNLTLNLGVRYELYTAIREPNGLVLEPILGNDPVAAILNPVGTVDFVGHNAGGTRFFKTDKNNFAPVLSVAYSPSFAKSWLKALFPGEGKTVIRAGYRESYVNDEFIRAADNALTGNAGLVSTVNSLNPATGTTALNARLNALPVIATPAFQVPRTFQQNNILGGLFGTVFAIDPDLQIPRYREWSFGIQRDIGFKTALEIRYVGGMSSNLVKGVDLNQVDIFNNDFLNDFLRARANLVLTGNPACVTAGCQTLTVYPKLGSGGLLSNATIRAQLLAGTVADQAITYVTNNLTGTVKFLPNPNTGVADLLLNGAVSRYNSLQVELRRQFSRGLYFQANYTFQKSLTDAAGVGQTRFDPPLTNANPHLDYGRADFDQTHVFNFNTLYELPFGTGKPFLNNGGWVNRLVGGFEFTSIIRVSTGAPISITDPRGTLNRAGRSGRQNALTNLNTSEVKGLIGIRKTKCGVFFIDPSVINFNFDTCTGTGRGAEGFATSLFPGQAFFNVAPGQTGNLPRNFINGPNFFNWDASIIKNVHIKESLKLQFRVEAFDITNRANFFSGDLNINSTNFGRVTSTFGSRVLQLVGRIDF